MTGSLKDQTVLVIGRGSGLAEGVVFAMTNTFLTGTSTAASR